MSDPFFLVGFEESDACLVNIDQCARAYQDENHDKSQSSLGPIQFLCPKQCQALLDHVHRKFGAKWSYGSYLEDRSFLLKGSYLEKSGNFLHLGIDLNVPTDTLVLSPLDLKILYVDDDHPVEQGWGPRIIAHPLRHDLQDLICIIAHLSAISVKPGECVAKNQLLAKVGPPERNGNWFPHIHIQFVRRPVFERYLSDDLRSLDGYGDPKEIDRLRHEFPDPSPILELKHSLYPVEIV